MEIDDAISAAREKQEADARADEQRRATVEAEHQKEVEARRRDWFARADMRADSARRIYDALVRAREVLRPQVDVRRTPGPPRFLFGKPTWIEEEIPSWSTDLVLGEAGTHAPILTYTIFKEEGPEHEFAIKLSKWRSDVISDYPAPGAGQYEWAAKTVWELSVASRLSFPTGADWVAAVRAAEPEDANDLLSPQEEWATEVVTRLAARIASA